jgi:primary-amine oxidase
VICVFERDTAAPLWRHSEAYNQAYEGRPATELVVRSIPSIAHYDYIIDWVFTQSGEIQVNIGATGIDAVKAVAARSAAEMGDTSQYGRLVAPGLVAIDHDHFFSIRLDFDIDGPVNSFVRERLAPVTLPAGNPRRSLWQLQAAPMPVEGALSAHDGPQVWRIENPNAMTALGYRPSYQIQGHGPTSLLGTDDWPQRRGAFSADNLWITARHPGELYAAGAYPNQSRGGDGLPAYVDGESISSADLVAWYTIGFHHVTRPEDWPVLSTIWQGVRLRPLGFFTRNPGLNVRREFRSDLKQ